MAKKAKRRSRRPHLHRWLWSRTKNGVAALSRLLHPIRWPIFALYFGLLLGGVVYEIPLLAGCGAKAIAGGDTGNAVAPAVLGLLVLACLGCAWRAVLRWCGKKPQELSAPGEQ